MSARSFSSCQTVSSSTFNHQMQYDTLDHPNVKLLQYQRSIQFSVSFFHLYYLAFFNNFVTIVFNQNSFWFFDIIFYGLFFVTVWNVYIKGTHYSSYVTALLEPLEYLHCLSPLLQFYCLNFLQTKTAVFAGNTSFQPVLIIYSYFSSNIIIWNLEFLSFDSTILTFFLIYANFFSWSKKKCC